MAGGILLLETGSKERKKYHENRNRILEAIEVINRSDEESRNMANHWNTIQILKFKVSELERALEILASTPFVPKSPEDDVLNQMVHDSVRRAEILAANYGQELASLRI